MITLLFFTAFPGQAEEILDLGTINVLTSRTSLLVSDISKGMSIITSDDIEKSSATSIPDLINTRSGIVVNNQLNNPKGISVNIRGFGETGNLNVLVLVDGRRTNQPDLSGVDWGQISLDSIERIEILRGASTVLYGDNASAGVINIITKKGHRDQSEPTKIRTEIGSYKYHKEMISSGSTFKNVDYFFDYAHEQTSGYRANNDYWANDYFGNLSWGLTDSLMLKLSLGYHRDRYGQPGALFASDIEALGREGTTHPDDRGWTSDVFVNAEPEIEFGVGGNDAKLSWFNSYRKRYNKGLNVSNFGNYETAHQINSIESRPKLEIESNIEGGFKNNFTVGVDLFYAKDKVRSGNQASAQDFTDVVKQTYEIYVLERVQIFDQFLVNVGGRGTQAEYLFDQTAVATSKERKTITDGAMNFGLGYKYNKNSQIYFDYSRSLRLPATDEFYQNKWEYVWGSGGGLNTGLKHQIGHNYEFGFRDISLPWLKTDANFFLMDIKNEIYFDPTTFKNSNYSPQTRHWGFEVEGKTDFLGGLFQPFIHWAWQDAFFKGGEYSGKKVPFVPKNKISSGITVNPLKGLLTTISMTWIDKRFAISDQNNNQPKLNSFVTFDFKIDYTWKGIDVWFGVKNMIGRKYDSYGVYSSGAGDVGFYPAPGRNYLGGASFEF